VNRRELEHIIRAASTIAEDDELIIVGSQSILGEFPDAPKQLLVSNEADLYPRNHPERWELIDGSIGELSPFHKAFGYYAQGVEEGTATLPKDWENRLVPVAGPATRGATGWCISAADLMVEIDEVLRLLALTPILDEKHRALLEQQIRTDARGAL